MNKNVIFLAILAVLLAACPGGPRVVQTVDEDLPVEFPAEGGPLPVSVFTEIWGYVVAGRESFLEEGMPLTDVGYFGAEIDSYGKLTDVPRRRTLQAFPGRVHLVVSCNGRALSYFTLRRGGAERRELIADLLAAVRDYDGLQINFENVPQRSQDDYFTFLQELRAGLPRDKMFTVALAARTRTLQTDVYDYERILPVVDRILVMAYDEHWSGSRPGPVASMDWCRRVAEYSMRVIGPEKLVMGIPFYGRAWGDYGPSRALIYTSIERIIEEHHIHVIGRSNGIPYFDYNRNVSIRVYFEDAYSLAVRMDMYKNMDVDKIGFWRVGQETSEAWDYMRIAE